jgi:hypothetical protein
MPFRNAGVPPALLTFARTFFDFRQGTVSRAENNQNSGVSTAEVDLLNLRKTNKFESFGSEE